MRLHRRESQLDHEEPLQCEELATGKRNAAVLKIGRDGIRTRVYRFDEFLHIKKQEFMYLRTEKNEFVTLRGNLTSSSGETSRFAPTPMSTYCQEIHSSCAIVGASRWEETDRVYAMMFSLKNCDRIFDNESLLQRVVAAKLGEPDPGDLCRVDGGSCEVRIRYARQHVFMRGITTDIQPRFFLKLREPKPLSTAYNVMMDLVEFVSFVAGRTMQPEEIVLWRGDHEAARDDEFHSGPFQCHWLWPKEELEQESSAGYAACFSAWDDDDLKSLREAIGVWMRRASTWHDANQMMMAALQNRRSISPDRLIMLANGSRRHLALSFAVSLVASISRRFAMLR